MTSSLLVVVHGATGSQGLPVVRSVLDLGHQVRGLARHPELLADLAPQAQPVVADLSDREALASAYAGADAVVVQLPLVFTTEAVAQAEAIAWAVERAGVARVVFNTGGPTLPRPVGVPYIDARVLLRDALDAGPARTLTLGPAAAYMENLAIAGSARRLLDGTVAYPLPEVVPIPWLATTDLAAQVADALGSEEEGSLVLVGPDALTGPAAAEVLSTALDRELAWETITPAAYEELLRPTIGAEAAAGIAGFYAAAPDAPPPPAPDPASVRVGATTLASWAAAQDWRALAATPATSGR